VSVIGGPIFEYWPAECEGKNKGENGISGRRILNGITEILML
jgi:hypothetical protein